MISLIDETVKTVRRISSELRPGILDDLGLIPALEWQSQEFQKRTGIQSEFMTYLKDFHPDRNLATNIFRVYQEALTNIARHANAAAVKTWLEVKDGFLRLIIKDDGEGFDMESVKKKNSLGLVGMKERARMFKGELVIEPNTPRGTIVILKAPLILESHKVLS
jgi:two-component system sensor histidine kinase UhpB